MSLGLVAPTTKKSSYGQLASPTPLSRPMYMPSQPLNYAQLPIRHTLPSRPISMPSQPSSYGQPPIRHTPPSRPISISNNKSNIFEIYGIPVYKDEFVPRLKTSLSTYTISINILNKLKPKSLI